MSKLNHDTGQKSVFAWMADHPGSVYSAPALTAEMGLDPMSSARAGQSMISLFKKGMIERLSPGFYVYRSTPSKPVTPPQPPPAERRPEFGEKMDVLGTRKSTGNLILQDGFGNLYEATEL